MTIEVVAGTAHDRVPRWFYVVILLIIEKLLELRSGGATRRK
jgi:hypothetical protein